MDKALYDKWKRHPIRDIIKRARQGDTIREDELEDLRLPPRVHRALKGAIAKAGDLAPLEADDLSARLVEALPDGHETRAEHEERRAMTGDADALANVQAREAATARLADRIMGDAR